MRAMAGSKPTASTLGCIRKTARKEGIKKINGCYPLGKNKVSWGLVALRIQDGYNKNARRDQYYTLRVNRELTSCIRNCMQWTIVKHPVASRAYFVPLP